MQMQSQRLSTLDARRERAAPQALREQARRLESLQARLTALDPKRVLERGYAWLDDGEGGALTSVAQLTPGQDLRAVLADGEASLQVLSTVPTIPRA